MRPNSIIIILLLLVFSPIHIVTSNNFSGSQPSVTAPDLYISTISFSQSKIIPKESANVTLEINNNVSIPASTFRIGIYISTTNTETGTLLTDLVIDSLAGGSSQILTKNITIPTETPFGDYYIIAVADYLGNITEIDETNNLISSTTVSIYSPYDIHVDDVGFNTNTVSAWSYTDIYLVFANNGDSPEMNFTIDFYLMLPDLSNFPSFYRYYHFEQQRFTANIDPGSLETHNFQVYIPKHIPTNDYRIEVVVDQNDDVIEKDESNNMALSTSFYRVEGKKDLYLSAISFADTSAPNSNVTVSITIKNYFGDNITDFTTLFYLSNDRKLGSEDILIGNLTLPEFSMIMTSDFEFNTSVYLGEYYIITYLDPKNDIIEFSESNNINASITTITINEKIETDPDGTRDTATLVVLNNMISSTLNSTDTSDYYKIFLPSEKYLQLNITQNSSNTDSFIQIEILDLNGNSINVTSIISGGSSILELLISRPGNYTIHIFNINHDTNVEYEFTTTMKELEPAVIRILDVNVYIENNVNKVDVIWTIGGYIPIPRVNIFLLQNNQTKEILATDLNSDFDSNNSYSWSAKSNILVNDSYKIEIELSMNSTINDISDQFLFLNQTNSSDEPLDQNSNIEPEPEISSSNISLVGTELFSLSIIMLMGLVIISRIYRKNK